MFNYRKGKEYFRTHRKPNELFKMAIDLMVDNHSPASQVKSTIETCWRPLGINVSEYDLGVRKTHNNYRRMIPWISRAQVCVRLELSES